MATATKTKDKKQKPSVAVYTIQTLIHESYQRDMCAREERFWTDYRCAKELSWILEDDIEVPSYKKLYQQNEHYMPTRKLITDIAVAYFYKRSETIYEKLSRRRKLCG